MFKKTQSKTDTIASINKGFTNLCISANELVNERWNILTDTEKNAMNDNMQYAYHLPSSGTYVHKNMETFYENSIFLQVQGDTALCGLCALNNGDQEEKIDINMLNSIADQLWISHYTDLC